ncbi:hypothetical protein BT96DRAFT_938918 [Gymnopus androsaceus JB14]|uniref:Uncharacterized protein n=1 Tax=Gymnopus androsaceus JB14 TaxID=1447944 RepID=A0A6A4HTX6_9AGAR|nr:hypothetical protein BT96DRAFT_938918 [Gymnopus androsaceus JB14]
MTGDHEIQRGCQKGCFGSTGLFIRIIPSQRQQVSGLIISGHGASCYVINVNDDDAGFNTASAQAEADKAEIEHLHPGWGSPIYTFFKTNVTVGYENGQKYHYFACNAHHCKNSKDKSSTGNLQKHTAACFGQDAVDAAMQGHKHLQPDGSIYAAFGRKGSVLVNVTHCAHMDNQIHANIVQWITENNRAVNIVEDWKFQDLMLAGCPQSSLPSYSTVARDIQTSFA